MREAPDDTPVRASWRDPGGDHERVFLLGVLRAEVLRLIPGDKTCYVTDIAFPEDNVRHVIEWVFLDQDADQAARKCHLTARQAGRIDREAGAARVIPFHFSPRYTGREAELRAEIEAARA